MTKRYNPAEIEPKWQKIWAEEKIGVAQDFSGAKNLQEFREDEKTFAKTGQRKFAKKFVMLTEFPYPSGAGLHMGHLREYTLGDIIARHKRMSGYNVLYPMGYDAFGLPTENYAIKNHISPAQATADNIANFRRQFDMMGYSIDWTRSFATSDPSYYKWTQWLFLQFFAKNMAYQAEIAINWCPFCKTGLANEEVVNGRHERCDTIVEKKVKKQWMLRITDYAEKLIDGLSNVDYSPRIAKQQIDWIGKSVGAEVDFQIADEENDNSRKNSTKNFQDNSADNNSRNSETSSRKITVFTTRPDTLYGATFMVLAPEHPLVREITTDEQREKVDSYIRETEAKSDVERQENREKTGVFTGAFAINPVNNEKIPIWIADYVLTGYGTGAIMAVPAHDERDFAFAKKFDLPVREVIGGGDIRENAYVGQGKLVNSGDLNGLTIAAAKKQIVAKLAKVGAAREKINYKLRDWVYSRQHYWGEPIPIIHCAKCGAVAVPDDQLPVELPKVDHYEPTDDGESPLSRIPEFVNVKCPKCGAPARRETDTMPNWAGSNWYYLRYFDAHNSRKFADLDKLKYWGMVDLYLGGMEHTTLHLLYSRFHHQFLYDQKLVPNAEPYAARRGQGIVLAADGRKMSKSLGNVVDPTEIIASGYGADAARLAVAFLAPYDQTTPWSPEGVAGCYRFLGRVWSLANEIRENSADNSDEKALRALNFAIKKVGDDIAKMNFNTAVAALMECVNELNKIGAAKIAPTDFAKFVQILAPFAPHIAEEIWRELLGFAKSVHVSDFPEADEKYLANDQMTIAVQVNGKLRGEIAVATDEVRENIEKLALAQPNVAKFLGAKKPARVIYVPGRVVNIVVAK